MKELIDLVNEHLDEYLQITYPEDIFKAMKYTLMLPGKRLRPVMCLETARILGCDIKKVMPAACAIEMLHVQSLIHDDLPCMDNDDFRRGKPLVRLCGWAWYFGEPGGNRDNSIPI